MSEEAIPATRPAADSGNSKDAAFRKLYVTGVVGWVLGMAALFGASWIFSKPETGAIAMLWMLSHCWIAYLFGLLLLGLRGFLSKASPSKAMLAYVVPVALLAGMAGICLAIYPDASLKADLLTFLPVVLAFYCFGCLWMALGTVDRDTFPRAVMPSVMGGLVLFGIVAVPAFASNAFRYRNAFRLHTKETTIQDGLLIFDGTLEIRKSGNYRFSAPRDFWSSDPADGGERADTELGEIQWGEAGAPGEGAVGAFPLRIVWKKGVLQNGVSRLPSDDEVGIFLEVRGPDQDGGLIYSVSADPAAVK